MTEKHKEPRPKGTSSYSLEDELGVKKQDRRTVKQQADKKSMEFGRRMGAKDYERGA